MATLGEDLVRRLANAGIDTVFGIPGVHTIELYRGLGGNRIRHVTPRHEQGAGFMADGYARMSGRPAAAFVITGPGLTNIATAMAQAYADSIPMLVVSSVNRRGRLGQGAGDLHEVRRQGLIGEMCAAFSHTILSPDELPATLARAFAVFESARPRPVHIEIPVDLLNAEVPEDIDPPRVPVRRPAPDPAGIDEAASWLAAATAPMIVVGGGALRADVRALAERLGAPVVMTTNARDLMPHDHPLAVPCSPSLDSVRGRMVAADVVLALGTEWGRTDFDMYDGGKVPLRGRLIRVDIDPAQIHRGAPPALPLMGDAALAVAALLAALDDGPAAPDGNERAAGIRNAAREEMSPDYRAMHDLLAAVRDAAPGAAIVGDSTNPVYAGNMMFGIGGAGGRWFNAATGYGALGYGLPAAIGAGIASAGPVVALAGDGGIQFSIAEIGAAIEEGLTLIILVWNNRGYGEIKRYMIRAGVETVGVDLVTPDFCAIARAWGGIGHKLELPEDLPRLIRSAIARGGVTLIEIEEAMILPSLAGEA